MIPRLPSPKPVTPHTVAGVSTARVPGQRRRFRVVAGDIGDNPREYEFEPLTAPATQPITVPTPAPATPEREPEQVPA